MPSENIQILNMATKMLNMVNVDNNTLPAFTALQLYKKTLERYYYPNGSHTHLVILNVYEIDQLVLTTEVDFSNFTNDDIHSPEFQEMLDAFVLCIGVTFDRYRKISSTFIKANILTAITRQLIMDFSE